jgi:NAD(P)H dehydrogenase (quinone)
MTYIAVSTGQDVTFFRTWVTSTSPGIQNVPTLQSIPSVYDGAMNVFIVHAHHEPASFNGALTRAARETLEGTGHEVVVSDLYAMGFDPVSDRRNFSTVNDPSYLKQQQEERFATDNDGFAPDLRAEMEKLFACDALIFQFPLWWFGLPAILKGWVDRVFALGRIYGGGRWYDDGVFAGKRAMLSVTIGGPASMYTDNGLNGEINTILYPINHGILRFTGFDVLPPFLVYAPARITEEERLAEIERYRRTVLDLWEIEPIRYRSLRDYDERYTLRETRSENVR